MATKTSHKTNAELAREEYRTQARIDSAPAYLRGEDGKLHGLLPSIAERREQRGLLTERELLKRASDAARLELRPPYSPDDRADVAATIIVDLLTELGDANGAIRADSPRASLTAMCDRAKTLRRSIDRQRARDDKAAQDDAARYALSAEAIGADHTPAAHVAAIASSGAEAAATAATAICGQLGLPADVDSPVWAQFYCWARGKSGEECAAERGVTYGAWKVRLTRGAKFCRNFYSAAELLSRLTAGVITVGDPAAGSGEHVYVLADLSREAHGRTRMLADVASAEHWRDHQITDAPMASRIDKTIKRHHKSAKAARGTEAERAQHVADSLRSIARQYAQQARGAERAAATTSALRSRED